MSTVKQLADKLAKAEAEVARLREEIASRAGEVDEVRTATKPAAKATATTKAAG